MLHLDPISVIQQTSCYASEELGAPHCKFQDFSIAIGFFETQTRGHRYNRQRHSLHYRIYWITALLLSMSRCSDGETMDQNTSFRLPYRRTSQVPIGTLRFSSPARMQTQSRSLHVRHGYRDWRFFLSWYRLCDSLRTSSSVALADVIRFSLVWLFLCDAWLLCLVPC